MNRQSYERPEAVVADDADALAARLGANGFVVLRDVVPREAIAAARRAYQPLLDAARRRGANRGPHRHSIGLPFAPPFSDPSLYANPAILAVIERVLGPEPACACFGSDTCEPGAERQPVHRDQPADLFPEARDLALPPFEITVNVPLVDVDLDNGPMELWPGGTHRQPEPPRLEQVAAAMPSVRATLEVGSVLLRDMRAWHRGTPNRSDAPRTLLAYAYTRPWFRYFHADPVRVPAARWAELPEVERRLLRFAAIVA